MPDLTVRAELAAGILPVREDGRILLLLRPTGTWEPPTGRLVPGETFAAGAAREVYEETGLLAAPQRIFATWVGERTGGGLLASVTYAGRVADAGIRLSGEHLDHRWVTPDEWLSLPSWWSRQNIRSAASALASLPPEVPPALSIQAQPDGDIIIANLGAGMVLLDTSGREPLVLLLRRRKPPAGLWENPGGMLEPGEDFAGCARRETIEETGLAAEPKVAWWARVEPWRGPGDPELYAGVAFLGLCSGGDVRLEEEAHDVYRWVSEPEWRELRTWYTAGETDMLWGTVRSMA